MDNKVFVEFSMPLSDYTNIKSNLWVIPKEGKLPVSLEIDNLFGKEYISVINASDYETGTSTYQQGAPRSVMLTMGVKF